ncbi:hypothetical protein N7491_003561 [Penicillium cf. griseofulvum]|uniref:Uncharacterized protein n=1 Tax=Penicillium cf. griseofulvum TaxID=2972120 RepID=A0A9W9MQV6_9EURO|nr:hypothetical protein N7472_002262 [Penicillium cf. griseofulvum]KAJ5441155.1 hypothetical protein N7491_003561 [Penicillium cf. griseofulvum]KAJ5449203.1 hypothetical protein N7445_004024 [Penicillium cf. griseofulvum]
MHFIRATKLTEGKSSPEHRRESEKYDNSIGADTCLDPKVHTALPLGAMDTLWLGILSLRDQGISGNFWVMSRCSFLRR